MLLPRLKWGKLIQFYTGHNYLARHDFLCYGAVDESYDPMCTLCDFNYLQTSEHIVSECPYFLGNRSQIFGAYVLDPPYDYPIGKVLSFLFQSGLDAFSWAARVQNET